MKPRSAKNKGKRLQNTVRDALLDNFDLESDDVRSTGMGQQGEDIQLSPKAREILPFNIECKSLKKIGVYRHYEQAITHGDYEPLLIVKQDRSKPLVVVDFEYFIKLLKKGINEQE